jgi:hypothetical protein
MSDTWEWQIRVRRSGAGEYEDAAATEGFELVRTFTEVETGKGSDALDRHRPTVSRRLRNGCQLSRRQQGHQTTMKPSPTPV